MEVILLEKVGKLGHLGDVVKVKDGYARNFLIPSKKALRVTKANLEMFEKQKADLQTKNEAARTSAQLIADKIKGKTFVVIRQAGDTGHLYGSVSTRDLANVLKENGANIDYTKITIDTPIKEIGIYEVKVALHPEVVEVVKVNVARSEEEAKAYETKLANEAKKAEEKKAKAKKEEAVAEKTAVENEEKKEEVKE
ncbi:50S ribosomal protein L9 [bacterium]|nr:50S ribosomal protein L9 [bacterium]